MIKVLVCVCSLNFCHVFLRLVYLLVVNKY